MIIHLGIGAVQKLEVHCWRVWADHALQNMIIKWEIVSVVAESLIRDVGVFLGEDIVRVLRELRREPKGASSALRVARSETVDLCWSKTLSLWEGNGRGLLNEKVVHLFVVQLAEIDFSLRESERSFGRRCICDDLKLLKLALDDSLCLQQSWGTGVDSSGSRLDPSSRLRHSDWVRPEWVFAIGRWRVTLVARVSTILSIFPLFGVQTVLWRCMFDKLVLAIVLYGAILALVGLILAVSSLMVFAVTWTYVSLQIITDCSKPLTADVARVRFVSGVSSLVDKEVSFLCKDLATLREVTLKEVLSAVRSFLVKV